MIDYKNKLVCIHIPKTAGTSVESALLKDKRIEDHSIETVPLWLQHSKTHAVISSKAAGDLKFSGKYYFNIELE